MKSNVSARALAGLGLVVAFVALFFEPKGNIGVTARTINGHSTFDAGSNPIALVVSFVMAGVYILIFRMKDGKERRFETAGIWRRFGAFLVDFLFSMLIVSPWLALISLEVEARRTGVFAWTVHRDYLADGDTSLTLMSVAFAFLFVLAYFTAPVYLASQSPGAALLGIAFRYDTGKRPSLARAVGRELLGYLALCGCFISVPLALSNPEKRMWHDLATHTRVVKWLPSASQEDGE